jgi:hypothetical protein
MVTDMLPFLVELTSAAGASFVHLTAAADFGDQLWKLPPMFQFWIEYCFSGGERTLPGMAAF